MYRVLAGVEVGGEGEWGREGIIQPKAETTGSISIKEETNVTGCEELATALGRTGDPVPSPQSQSQ